MSKEFLRVAVGLAGGQVALAAGIKARMPVGTKVSQAHIWKWLNRVKSVVPPGDYVVPIADTVGYQVTPHQLREDMYPNPTDGLPAEIASQVVAGNWPPEGVAITAASKAACNSDAARRSTDRAPRRRKSDPPPAHGVTQSALAFDASDMFQGVAVKQERRKVRA